MLVNFEKVRAVATGLAIEHFRFHRQTGDVAGNRIGSTAHEAETELGYFFMGAVASPQIVLATRLQVIHIVSLATFFKSHHLAQCRIGL
jgi:hypothetical protein